MIATTETLQVPAGTGVKDSSRKTDLLYNEYIVYDVAQVFFMRHLVQANCPTPHSYFRNLHLGSPLNLCLI